MRERARPRFPVRLERPASAAQPQPPLAPYGSPAAQPTASATPAQSWGLDSQAVRRAMVLKLQSQGIRDTRVLQAMGQVERHRFVDTALAPQAYEDTSLPIGLGQTISKPSVVARMIELLLAAPLALGSPRLGRVLEIGTGCAYQAAVLSLLAQEVYSVERLRALHERSRQNLRALRLPNVHLLLGDGQTGYAQGAPYAAIIAAASGAAVPQAWVEQLAPGGRLVAPAARGPTGEQALLVLDKTPTGLRQHVLEAVHFVPLKSGLA